MKDGNEDTHKTLPCLAQERHLVLPEILVPRDVTRNEINGVHQAWVRAFARIGVIDRFKEAADVDIEVVALAVREEEL